MWFNVRPWILVSFGMGWWKQLTTAVNQCVALVFATGYDQAAQNLRISSAVTICCNTGTGHNLNHAVKLFGSLRLPSDNAMLC
jgi:hypothetical protein